MAALALDARRIGGYLNSDTVLPCSLQGKNTLTLLTEEIRLVNVSFSRSEMTALVALKSLRRTPLVAKNDNVVQFAPQCRARYNELPDHVKEILVAGFDDVDDTVTEVPQPKPQQVAPKPAVKTKRQAKAELKAAKKAAKRKEDKPEHKAEVTPPKIEPVVIKETERKAESTVDISKNLTPMVLRHYIKRIEQGKMRAARMFLRECVGLNEAASLADYDLRLTHMHAFVEEHLDKIQAACEKIEPVYDGEAVNCEWSAPGTTTTWTRSHRVPNWINKAGKLHRKGWKIQQYKQELPYNYLVWLEKNVPWTKTNQRPVAVTLLGTGMIPMKLEHNCGIFLHGIRVGTQRKTEYIEVPAGNFSIDRIEAKARAYRSTVSSGPPVIDLPPPPVVAATVVGDRRNVEAVNDAPPWEDDEESFLSLEIYDGRRLERVAESIEEMYQPFFTDEVYEERRLERVVESIIESDTLYYQGIIGFNDGAVLAGTSVPVSSNKTQGETLIETILLDTQEEVDVMTELREEFQATLFGPGNHFVVPRRALAMVDKNNELLAQRNDDQAWLFHRNPLPGSAYVMFRTNPHLIAEANRWDHNRKQEMMKAVREERQSTRTKSKMSQKKLLDMHWQRLLTTTTPLTVTESLARMDNSINVHTLYGGLRPVMATPRRIHIKATRLRRKLVLSKERQAIVATAKAKALSRAVINGECKQNNPYYKTPVTEEPAISETVAATVEPFVGPPTQESLERMTISMIRASVIKAEAWVAKANAVLNGKVVNINDARELMIRYKEVPVNLALG